MTEPSRFEWERHLLADPAVEGTQLLVLLALATYMDRDGTGARPSQATLAARTGLAERTVRRHLTSAVNTGLLERVERGHRRGDGSTITTSYRATIPTSTGQTCPVDDDLNRTPETGTGVLNRPNAAPQPANRDASTGLQRPPTMVDHLDQGEADADLRHRVLAFLMPRTGKKAQEVADEVDKLLDEWLTLHGPDLVAMALDRHHGRYDWPSQLGPSVATILRQLQREHDDARRSAAAAACDLCDEDELLPDGKTVCAHPAPALAVAL